MGEPDNMYAPSNDTISISQILHDYITYNNLSEHDMSDNDLLLILAKLGK